jgi:hypothetical protein
MYKYTKEQMDGIEKMLEWFHSKAKTEFKFTDERWGNEVGNNPLLIHANGQLIVDWMTRKVTDLEYDDRDKLLWNAIRELYMDNHKDENAYMVTQIVRK